MRSSIVVRSPEELSAKFISSGLRNAWCCCGVAREDIRVYLRLTRRAVAGAPAIYLDVANVQVREDLRGRGVFSQFLDAAEELAGSAYDGIFVENLLSEDEGPSPLERHLLRRGYVRDSLWPPSAYKIVSGGGRT